MLKQCLFIITSMSNYQPREDTVKRPDHYQCLNCGARFNDAKLTKEKKDGIFISLATCPVCSSTKLKISWWEKKSNEF